jgi:hypothetical protein
VSKIGDGTLLSMGLADAFDGTELRLLATLLDDHMMDWPEERRASYEALYDDLEHLARRLLSNGHDFGKRATRRWAEDPPTVPDDEVVHVICDCGTRITVPVRTGGLDLLEWNVTCPKHGELESPYKETRHLGVIAVKGVPPSEAAVRLAIQQALIHHAEDLRNFDSHAFRTTATFK